MASAPRDTRAAHALIHVVPREQHSDEELAERSQTGDPDALHLLVERYRRFARHRSRGYFLLGGSADDLEQEALIGLVEAARDFRATHGVTFRAFASLCITRQVLAAVRSASSRKHEPLNSGVCIDSNPEATVTPVVSATTTGADPADVVVALDTLRRMRSAISCHTSVFERAVLALHADGRTYAEIGDALGQRAKTIDNALQRSRRKLQPTLRAVARSA